MSEVLAQLKKNGSSGGSDLGDIAIIASNSQISNSLTIAANSADGTPILVEYMHNTAITVAPTITCSNGIVSNKQNHRALFTGSAYQSIGCFVVDDYDPMQAITIVLTNVNSNAGLGFYCNIIALN